MYKSSELYRLEETNNIGLRDCFIISAHFTKDSEKCSRSVSKKQIESGSQYVVVRKQTDVERTRNDYELVCGEHLNPKNTLPDT